MKYWKLNVIGYCVIGTGCYVKRAWNLALVSPGIPNRLKDFKKILRILISINWPSLVT